MTLRVVAVDWSGAARRDGCDKIRWWEVRGGIASTPTGRIGRDGVIERLIAEAARDPSLIAGLDFAFSMPAWYVREHGFDAAPQLWSWLAEGDRCEELLLGCPPPFWGRGCIPRPRHGRPELRATDTITLSSADGTARRFHAKSVFQVGGAGSVGTGSLRGMALFPRLRDAGFAIWPFDAPRLPMALEIYPRVFTGPLRKTRVEERVARLSPYRARFGGAIVDAAATSEDDLDAFVSAIAMWDARADLLRLPEIADHALRLEGIIWHPGWHTVLDRAARHD